MTVYILINTSRPNDPVLGVYDSEFLAEKRKLYFKTVYTYDELKIVNKSMEYIDRE
ncbi:hypothetical protein SAMN05428975_3977 [Mucilaginibacter sp. OK268]|jgi:hypothetical protein|nr:hypothetical protein SAMN05428975_3977 [Mucilaginibacter sp. OK268]